MPAKIISSSVIAGTTTVSFAEFTELVNRHLDCYTTTRDIEREADILKSVDFAEVNLESYIRHVCTWGGYSGIAGRILNQNSITKIRTQFGKASARLETTSPDVQGALQEINRVLGLGTPSFGSKHLRFLRPDVCPILDSILRDDLGYPFNPQGYKSLSDDCLQIAKLLELNGVVNPMNRANSRWFAADVEMAIFARLNNL